MIKEFYSNPGTFEPEVKEAFSFPEQTVMKEWVRSHEEVAEGPFESWINHPKESLMYLAIFGCVMATVKAMGPQGEAMKIIVNKRMSPFRYYGLRAVPLALGSYVLYTVRTKIDFSNPYSRGELK
jgi:hypothetical protein